MKFNNKDLFLLDQALSTLKQGFESFPDTLNEKNQTAIEEALLQTARRLHDNYPYFEPNYAGQMLKPPHAVARLAYMMALYINPNNHALDGSRASSPMEKECVDQIAMMYSWQQCLGHLTSGGTMANLEALWIAGKIEPNKLIVSSELAHYTHERISSVLRLNYKKIKADSTGRMDVVALEEELKLNIIGTVVVTMGTTGIGSVDPLEEILNLQKRYKFRIHIDAAYGGYFRLADELPSRVKTEFSLISQADSIVIDPHKHGLQPYGCGCVLFRDPAMGQYYKHDSPYTYFSSQDLHLGEISLECSRAGAAAVALWTTMNVFPLTQGGEFAKSLNACHAAARQLFNLVNQSNRFVSLLPPDLDIVVWGVKAATFSEMSDKALKIFDACADDNLHLALIKIPTNLLPVDWGMITHDQDEVTCLRSCLMKPAHREFVPQLWSILLDKAEQIV